MVENNDAAQHRSHFDTDRRVDGSLGTGFRHTKTQTFADRGLPVGGDLGRTFYSRLRSQQGDRDPVCGDWRNPVDVRSGFALPSERPARGSKDRYSWGCRPDCGRYRARCGRYADVRVVLDCGHHIWNGDFRGEHGGAYTSAGGQPALHTPIGHIAIGWLIVEDLFTILVLVLLPALFDTGEGSDPRSAVATFAWALIKLTALVGFALVAGQRIIPWLLGYIARTGSRDLFTLAVLVLALGIAVGSAQLFGASMALGAFLAGMIVGQSEFSARSASEALPMRDAFAVLFFVSVGMLFDPYKIAEDWPLILATLGIVIIGKPLAALLVVLLFRRPLRSALSIAVALAQIGEFSFILASLALGLNLLPPEATNALVVVSVVSITLNPLLYKCIPPAVRWLERIGLAVEPKALPAEEMPEIDEAAHRVIVVGYGPVGQTLSRILKDNGLQVVVIEMNLKTIQELRAQGELAVYGDASLREVLHHAGIEHADGLIIAASSVPADTIVKAARELNPNIRVLTRATYLKESQKLREAGANAVFSSEGEVALAMTAFLMRQLGATDEQIDRERERVRADLF
jgi:monovalent cation:H+ antiporter-2, CPA2 family